MQKRIFYLLLVILSLFITMGGLEILFRIGSVFLRGDRSSKQEEFIQTLTYPFSYGLVRPNVSISDLRVYFSSGKFQPDPISIETNNIGIRMRDIHTEKKPDTIRITAMGDSCTFGWMLAEEETYPRQLETALNKQEPGRYEVLNFGIPGYTSFHGLLQYKRLVKQFQPDVVILAYGFNDSYDFRFSEEEYYTLLKEHNLTDGLSGSSLFLYDHSSFYHWFLNRIKSLSQKEIERELLARAGQKKWFARVSRSSYKKNLSAIVQDVRAYGGKSIVMNLDLPNSWVKHSVREVAEELDVPHIDIQDLFYSDSRPDAATIPLQNHLQKPGVHPAQTPKSMLLFRVHVPKNIVPDESISLLVNSSQHEWPWQTPMYDDGTHGDERVNDGVWSLQVDFEDRGILDYSFLTGQISEDPPLYENSDKALRFYFHVDLNQIPSGSAWLSPVHTINRIPFEHLMVPADVIHPNAAGNEMIVEALMPIVSDE